ncbi:MAG: response regulator [Gemmatimonadales bacterium]|nr:MAG: response regulator [Gemmatimonadales bacterium]
MSNEEEETKTTALILVVEDDPTVLGFIRRTLKRGGFSCLTAETAEDALQVSSASERPIDLLVLDIMLPDSWGTRLMQDVRAQHPEVAVILTSGFTGDDPVLAAGVAARDPDIPFLKKPFTPEELLETVREKLADGPNTPQAPNPQAG